MNYRFPVDRVGAFGVFGGPYLRGGDGGSKRPDICFFVSFIYPGKKVRPEKCGSLTLSFVISDLWVSQKFDAAGRVELSSRIIHIYIIINN
jgi:hypothetical protein